ncbi:hypothetical protein ABIC63_002893 [Pseudacidovorax sp. 1753]|uniref:hypothetical protein n=1 Tax=Pseudacidovorax sp. 1753 TaxID=3156419 RepID=UPI003394D8E7
MDIAIESFLKGLGSLRPEGMPPKLACLAATVEELTEASRLALERALLKRRIPTSRTLVNVGDSKIITNNAISPRTGCWRACCRRGVRRPERSGRRRH